MATFRVMVSAVPVIIDREKFVEIGGDDIEFEIVSCDTGVCRSQWVGMMFDGFLEMARYLMCKIPLCLVREQGYMISIQSKNLNCTELLK